MEPKTTARFSKPSSNLNRATTATSLNTIPTSFPATSEAMPKRRKVIASRRRVTKRRIKESLSSLTSRNLRKRSQSREKTP